MPGMVVPIVEILRGERWVMNHQEVFTVPVFGRSGEIETAGDDTVGPKDHIFGMGNGMRRIDEDRNAGVREERGRSIAFCELTGIEDDADRYPSTVRSEERLGDGGRGKGIGGNSDLMGFVFDGADYGGRRASTRGEVHLNGIEGLGEGGSDQDHEQTEDAEGGSHEACLRESRSVSHRGFWGVVLRSVRQMQWCCGQQDGDHRPTEGERISRSGSVRSRLS